MSGRVLSEFHPFRSREARDSYLARYDELAQRWPVPSETRTVETDLGQTYVRISGPTEAAPLVLLPGVWGNSLMWIPEIEAFSERYRVYAVDNICDFGRSVCARPIKKTEAFMVWLDGLFDGFGFEDNINLMGCSRGAWLCAEYALHAQDRLAKMVWHSLPAVASTDYVLGLTNLPRTTMALTRPSERTIGALIRWLMPDLLESDPDGFNEYVEDTVLGLTSFDRKVAGQLMGPRRFSDAELRRITIPVLHISGEHEKMCSLPVSEKRLRALMPHVETAVVEGAGHDLGTVRTQEFTERVLEFLGT